MAVAVDATPLSTFAPLTPPPDGPWDWPGLQTLEDYVAESAFSAAQAALKAEWAWIARYWPEAVLPTVPRPQLDWLPWGLALVILWGAPAVVAGADGAAVVRWSRSGPVQRAARAHQMPPQGPPQGGAPPPVPDVVDVTTRLAGWEDTLAQETVETITGTRRQGGDLDSVVTQIDDAMARWGKDMERLVQTELSGARADAVMRGATVPWAWVKTQPGACAVCRHAFNGRVFRLLHAAPADPARHAHTSLWPGKWTLNWGRPAAEQWPAVPRHPRCRCRIVPIARRADAPDQGR